ncbi:MAG: hypothetical protein FWF22_00265 [Treponema sp.]|nr:hypothetical protein [Treponema sp.]
MTEAERDDIIDKEIISDFEKKEKKNEIKFIDSEVVLKKIKTHKIST